MPQHFFEKQLQGEIPLSLETAKQLGTLAERLYAYQPWQALSEADLVFVRRPDGELRACSVMGSLGEVFMLAAYQGIQGYYLFQKIQGLPMFDIGEFLGEQCSVSVEYEKQAKVTVPDRELLKAVGYPAAKGVRAPQFRAVRPGYYPWYVTEPEGVALADCLCAMLFLCDKLAAGRQLSWWDVEGSYPLLSRTGAATDDHPQFMVEQFEPPPAPDTAAPAPVIDPKRLQGILARKRAAGGVLEADHFYTGAKIGKKDQRKSLVRLALAVDGKSGFVYSPHICDPGAEAGQAVANVILQALEAGAPPPREIHVRAAQYRRQLEPLARALGARLLDRTSLPALDHARDSLLGMMDG